MDEVSVLRPFNSISVIWDDGRVIMKGYVQWNAV